LWYHALIVSSAEAETKFMPIRVQCAKCKTTLAVKDHLAGKRVKCPKCQAPLSIPVAKKPVGPGVNQTELEALAAAALGDEPSTPPPTNSSASGINGANGHPAATVKPPIKFKCDYCDAEIVFEAELAGKRAPCPECRQIIKVPLPKEEKPKDWRTVEKKGPSAAVVNQPEKIDNAWGTETKSKVSQTALLEAGVIAKPKAPSIGMAGWIERGVKVFAVVALVGGIGWGIWSLRARSAAQELVVNLAHQCDPKWPAVIQGEFFLILSELALSHPGQRDDALEKQRTAWQKVAGITDERDKIDRDFFLIELAKAQVRLGGDDSEIRGKDRFEWNQEVFTEIDRTLKKIENHDACVTAVREVAYLFAEIKKPEFGITLAETVSAIRLQAQQAKALRLALYLEAGKITEAKQIAPDPEEVKGSLDFVTRCGYAEGWARKDKGKFSDAAKKVVMRAGENGHKIQALMAIAALPMLDPKDVKDACDMASELLKNEPRASVPPWVRLQHVRLVARHDAEEAKQLAQKLPAAYQRRAKLEIVIAILDKDPALKSPSTIIQELDNEGPGRALAWLAVARSKARANLSFSFAPESPEDEILRPLLKAVGACPIAPPK